MKQDTGLVFLRNTSKSLFSKENSSSALSSLFLGGPRVSGAEWKGSTFFLVCDLEGYSEEKFAMKERGF